MREVEEQRPLFDLQHRIFRLTVRGAIECLIFTQAQGLSLPRCGDLPLQP